LSTEDNTEALGRNTEQINKERDARSRLNGALDSFGTIVGGVIKGAPKAFAPILGAVPGLEKFQKSMEFAEGYVDVWRSLTTRGVHFSNELDNMIINVGRANLQIDQFQKLLENNTVSMAALGGTMNNGAMAFLTLQGDFERLGGPFEDLRKNLNLLGLNSEMIAGRFAQFDALAGILNLRERRETNFRNRAATQFAVELDRLSRLTGKQADQLAKEALDISRKGNVSGFAGQLDSDLARVYLTQGLQAVGETAGETVQRYVTDLVTRGFPDPKDPALGALTLVAGELRNSALNARAAFKAGNEELGQFYMRQAEIEAGRLRTNQRLGDLAALGGIAGVTQSAMQIETELNNSVAAIAAQANEIKAAELFPGVRNFTTDQLRQAQEAILAAEKTAQTNVSSDGNRLLDLQLSGMRKLQDATQRMQEDAVVGLTKLASASLQSLVDVFGQNGTQFGKDLYEAFQTQLKVASTALDAVSTATGASGRQAQQADTLIRNLTILGESLAASGESSASDAVDRLAREVGIAKSVAQANPNDATAQQNLSTLLENAQREISTNSNVFVTGRSVSFGSTITDAVVRILESLTPTTSNATGTLGTTGRLFANFGKETISALHGMEAVTTPDQMFEIVRNSALGAMQASSMAYEQSSSRNNTQILSGMLNTIRTIPAQVSQTQNANAEGQLQRTMTNLAADLTNSFETAINSTLVPSVDRLVAISTSHANTSDKIRRGITNMSGDMLRST
tara:strand:- start:806 stop:3028 length:2223 start_codon:yes stop_codon:yes gene_type:complete